ncbi:MAG: exodeoxyribonuclease VII small subunit [Alphaproteobacteria bacterium]|nr:exodeoxyribonuclease VII small subunit [Alphaproteobacteria bacterium]
MAAQDVTALSFEQALVELESIVRKLESGEASLEDSIDLYQRGAALKAHCEAKLRDATARIEKIQVGADGAPTGTVPFDA